MTHPMNITITMQYREGKSCRQGYWKETCNMPGPRISAYLKTIVSPNAARCSKPHHIWLHGSHSLSHPQPIHRFHRFFLPGAQFPASPTSTLCSHTANNIMPPITPFDVSINLHLRGLHALKALLTKTQASSDPAAAKCLPAAQSPHDAASLAFHVQSCTNLATSGLSLLSGTEQGAPVWPTNTENITLEHLIANVDKTIIQLEGPGGSTADLLDGVEDRDLEVTYGNGQTATWAGGREYILGYSIPNFMFHLCMAYSSLRSQGVDVGKMDFLVPFMVGMAPGF
ncbi:hypothetical protein B0H63DRAFT_467376 [Podospora didyma]|uniref:DUF1993 domain-containing protein n=1 Tax=Podospora didyma TaxID=330526 RepID=A0AAE0P144_9PEZI|nr:hypothetical protein B0H63DRAFT_467376 [Podospora didyma]